MAEVAEVLYTERRSAALGRMNALPRGARMQAAHDLRVAPSIVTNVLLGRIEREDILASLEGWLEIATPTSVAATGDSYSARVAEVLAFADAMLMEDEDASSPIGGLYDAYLGWTKVEGKAAVSVAVFVAALRSRWPSATVDGERVIAGIQPIASYR